MRAAVYEGFQFVDIRKPPDSLSLLILIEVRHCGKGLAPRYLPSREICSSQPAKTGKPVYDGISHDFKAGRGPFQPEEELTVVACAAAWNVSSARIITLSLSGGREHPVPLAPDRPKQKELFFIAVKHAGAFHMNIPGISGVDRSGGGGPVPAGENIPKRMPLGQGRFLGLMTYKTSELPAVRKAPVRGAEGFFAIHPSDVVQRFLPGHGKFGKVCIYCPDEASETVEHGIALWSEARDRPGDSFPELSVLTAAGTGNVSSRGVVVGDLAGPEIAQFVHDNSNYFSF